MLQVSLDTRTSSLQWRRYLNKRFMAVKTYLCLRLGSLELPKALRRRALSGLVDVLARHTSMSHIKELLTAKRGNLRGQSRWWQMKRMP